MASITTWVPDRLPSAWALAVLDIHDWLAAVANPDADWGKGYSLMLAAADSILLGESTRTGATIRAIARPPCATSSGAGARTSTTMTIAFLRGFLRRSAPVDELSETWASLS
jgi:hypothetical protein